MIPVAIYARYSTDKQDARSIDDQIRRCREYAERHGYEVVAVFSDAAMSGAHTDRANLRRMLEMATATKRPPFKAVIVDDLSRLSRDLGDTWRIIFTDLAAVDVKVIDASTGMASDANGARTMFAAMAMVNDTFLQLVRHETHRGLQGRAIAGFATGGSLFGYRTYVEPNPSDREHPRKIWMIDDEEAEIVRRIYRMFDGGSYGYRAIADTFNREGIAAPRNNGRGGKHGGGWCHTTVRAILTNEKYIGRWRWNATKWIRVPGLRARRQLERPESEHVVREYPELAIIDRRLWDRIQEHLKGRKQRGTREVLRSDQRVYLLSGLLRCGVCEGPLSVISRQRKNGHEYTQFGCTAHASRGSAICSNNVTVSEKKVTEAFLHHMRTEVLTVPNVMKHLTAAFQKRAAEYPKTPPGELERQLKIAEARATNATTLMLDMPNDLELRRRRDDELAEVRRLKLAVEARAQTTAPGDPPSEKVIKDATRNLLAAIQNSAPDRARDALAKTMTPLLLTPKIEGPEHLVEVSGTLDLAPTVVGYGRSGGRI